MPFMPRLFGMRGRPGGGGGTPLADAGWFPSRWFGATWFGPRWYGEGAGSVGGGGSAPAANDVTSGAAVLGGGGSITVISGYTLTAGSNRKLVVAVTAEIPEAGDNIIDVRFGTVSLTQVVNSGAATAGNTQVSAIWVLEEADFPVTETQNIVVVTDTGAGTYTAAATAMTLTGAAAGADSSDFDLSDSANTLTSSPVVVSAPALVVSVVGVNQGSDPTLDFGTETQIADQTAATRAWLGASTEEAASTGAHAMSVSWTSAHNCAHAAAAFAGV